MCGYTYLFYRLRSMWKGLSNVVIRNNNNNNNSRKKKKKTKIWDVIFGQKFEDPRAAFENIKTLICKYFSAFQHVKWDHWCFLQRLRSHVYSAEKGVKRRMYKSQRLIRDLLSVFQRGHCVENNFLACMCRSWEKKSSNFKWRE